MAFKPQDRLLLEDGRVYPVDALLLRGSCPDCSEPLEWAANVEGDDTDYTAECCEFVLRARPYALKVSVIERGAQLIWKEIAEYPDYWVSDRGDVRHGTRILRPDVDDRGRRRFTLCRAGHPQKYLASRLVLTAFVGPCPKGMEACHGPRSGDDITNLRWDTHSENMLDRKRHGTSLLRKVTAEQFGDIQALRSEGWSLRFLAGCFGITPARVSQITRAA